LAATRINLVDSLKQQTGDPAVAGRFNRFFAPRHCLVMAQIALSAMLLFTAGLFYRGAQKAAGRDLGFDPRGGLVAQMDFTLANTDATVAQRKLFAAVDRVRAEPGVRDVAVSTMMPYGSLTNTTQVAPVGAEVDGKPPAGENGLYTAVTAGYFRTIGVRVLRGRDFTEQESRHKTGPKVAILDESMAKKLFPKGDALGRHIRYTQPPADGSSAEMEVVGICSTHRHDVFDADDRARVFVPFGQAYNGMVVFHARLDTTDPEVVAAQIPTFHKIFRQLDPDLPVLEIVPFSYAVAKSIELWIVRLGAVLFGIFGVIALVLAVVGVYGVRSYVVERRTREIGIRMALGARPADVFQLVMRQGVLQLITGLALGALLCFAAGQLLAKLLYQVSPHDPVALLTAGGVLTAAALVATFLPARRAASVPPLVALRTE
jgi:predicted permease